MPMNHKSTIPTKKDCFRDETLLSVGVKVYMPSDFPQTNYIYVIG